MTPPPRQIRAVHDATTIRVYQAYSHHIADAACAAQRFVSPPFSLTRTTWIKPSFLWMMYRSGWGLKDDGQRRILAVDITRDGFDRALGQSVLSQFEPDDGLTRAEWQERVRTSCVRIQWDPERDLDLAPRPYRALQMGLGDDAVRRYVHEWTVRIEDVTGLAQEIHARRNAGDREGATALLPPEPPYEAAHPARRGARRSFAEWRARRPGPQTRRPRTSPAPSAVASTVVLARFAGGWPPRLVSSRSFSRARDASVSFVDPAERRAGGVRL